MIEIKLDDLTGGEVISLLEEHLADMYATSPAESVHALDVEELKGSDICFYSAWHGAQLMGCVALKRLNNNCVELKSMRTTQAARGQGIGRALLTHAVNQARQQGYKRISLETGTEDYFKAARNLYRSFGFELCLPFANYCEDENSQFMTMALE